MKHIPKLLIWILAFIISLLVYLFVLLWNFDTLGINIRYVFGQWWMYATEGRLFGGSWDDFYS